MSQSEVWQPPPQRLPRQRYSQQWNATGNDRGAWSVSDVLIIDHDAVVEPGHDDDRIVARYQRNFHGKPPFDAFRQRDRQTGEWRHFALASSDYTATGVLALDGKDAGAFIANEEPDPFGFCPVGFYVPDWHDAHDGSVLPGSEYWNDNRMWPDGTLGFVWGCVWADDSDWKVQALDLSRIQDGIITRDDRWGYLRLDTISDDPKDFIRVSPGMGGGKPSVTFSVPKTFSIAGNHTGDGD